MVYDLKYGFLTPFVGIGECTASNLECDSSLFTDDRRFSPSIRFSKSGMSSMYRLLPDDKLLQSEHTVLQRLLRLEAFALDLLLILVPCAYSFSHASIHVLRHT